jgi:hypothetical protein
MKRLEAPIRWGVLIAALGILQPVLVNAEAADDRANVGHVEQVEQRVEASHAGRVRWLQSGSALFYLDLLRTGPDARLRARLADGSMLAMGADAELVVDEFVYAPGDVRTMTLRSLKGALLFIGEKLRGVESEVQIRTPVAILGIRGTEVWVGPIDGATGVLVLDGEVSVGTAKGAVLLGPGEGTMIGDDGGLGPVKTWGEGKVARALEMVSPVED